MFRFSDHRTRSGWRRPSLSSAAVAQDDWRAQMGTFNIGLLGGRDTNADLPAPLYPDFVLRDPRVRSAGRAGRAVSGLRLCRRDAGPAGRATAHGRAFGRQATPASTCRTPTRSRAGGDAGANWTERWGYYAVMVCARRQRHRDGSRTWKAAASPMPIRIPTLGLSRAAGPAGPGRASTTRTILAAPGSAGGQRAGGDSRCSTETILNAAVHLGLASGRVLGGVFAACNLASDGRQTGCSNMDDLRVVWTSDIIPNGPTVMRNRSARGSASSLCSIFPADDVRTSTPSATADTAGGEAGGYVAIGTMPSTRARSPCAKPWSKRAEHMNPFYPAGPDHRLAPRVIHIGAYPSCARSAGKGAPSMLKLERLTRKFGDNRSPSTTPTS